MYESQKKVAWSSLKAGIVVTIALTLVFFTVFFSGTLGRIFSPRFTLHARIGNVGGLREGAPVWIFGVEAGIVENIRIVQGGSVVTTAITREYRHLVYADAVARVRTMGLLGDRYIELDPGQPAAPMVSAGDTIRGEGAMEISEILTAGTGLIHSISAVAISLDTLLNSLLEGRGTLGRLIQDTILYDRLDGAIRRFSLVMAEWQRSDGTLKRLVKDPRLHQDLLGAVGRISSVLDSVQEGSGMAAALVSRSELADQARSILRHLDDLIKDIKENPKRYFSLRLF